MLASLYVCRYLASIQFTNDSFHQKHSKYAKTYRQEYIAKDFNGNTIAVTDSLPTCVWWSR